MTREQPEQVRYPHVEFFPGGDEIVPAFLTRLEAARLLRLDVISRDDGTEESRSAAQAIKSLDHLIAKGSIVPIRIGKSLRFSRDQLLDLARFSLDTAPTDGTL